MERKNKTFFPFSKDLEKELKEIWSSIDYFYDFVDSDEFVDAIVEALVGNSEFIKKIGIKDIEIIQDEYKIKLKITLGTDVIIETSWVELPKGDKGDKGDNITFKGVVANLDELPKDPTLGDTYYITNLRLSVCWTGEEWATLIKDGQGIKSIEAKDTQDGLIHTYELSWTNLDNETSPISEPLTIKDGEKGDQGEPATQEQVDLAIKNAPKKKLNNDDFIINDNEIRINWENLNDDFWETTPTQDDNVIQPKNNRSVSMNNQAIINVKEPLNNDDAVTKIYTDNILKNKQDQIYFENDPEPIIPVLDSNTFQRNPEGRFISIQDFISDGLETEAKTGGGAINELVHKKVDKIDLAKFTNLDLGQVPWDEADPALQVFIRFRELNSQWIGEGENQQIWPDDNFFEYDIKNDPPLTKETTEMTLYGTNNLYTGKIKVTFNFDDSLPISIGAGGHMKAIQRVLDKKGIDTYWELYDEEIPNVIKPKDDITQLIIPKFLVKDGYPSTPKGIFLSDVNENILLDNGVPNIGYLKEKYANLEYVDAGDKWVNVPDTPNIKTKNNQPVDLTNQKILNLGTPTELMDATNKEYVDKHDFFEDTKYTENDKINIKLKDNVEQFILGSPLQYFGVTGLAEFGNASTDNVDIKDRSIPNLKYLKDNYQSIKDENLITTNKNIVPAINEIYNLIGDLSQIPEVQ